MDNTHVSAQFSHHPLSLGQRLRQARLRLGWSQERLAEVVEVSPPSISRWEQDLVLPHPISQKRLCQALGLDPEMFIPHNIQREQLMPYPLWGVPYARNPHFTGRQEVLQTLRTMLLNSHHAVVTQVPAISGLGGIGKTQTALEYAYRFAHEYEAVFWLGAQSQETLLCDLLRAAQLLDLPVHNVQEGPRIIEAFKRWLRTHAHWLVILDNLEDLALLEQVIAAPYQGHLLLTTRSQLSGHLAQTICLQRLTEEEGALFLLRRTRYLALHQRLEEAPEQMSRQAREISRLLDGLPLALDQAGAYLEETGCSLCDYAQRYETSRRRLLGRRGRQGGDHPQSVLETLTLSCERVAQQSPAALDLLRLCSFLHPENIAEEIVRGGAPFLGPVLGPVAADPYALDEVFAVLRRFSLVQRQAEVHTFSVHRLLQAVLRESMSEQEQIRWLGRVVDALRRIFPDEESIRMTSGSSDRCERLIVHVMACASATEHWNIYSFELASLLSRGALYLHDWAYYEQAKHLFEQALSIYEHSAGTDRPELALLLHDLACLYWKQGRYEEAEPLLTRSLGIWERIEEPDPHGIASVLNRLATVFLQQGRYEEAEPLLKRALRLWEQSLGPEHSYTATALTNLAYLWASQGKYTEAEPLYQRAVSIQKQAIGATHHRTAYPLVNLAELYMKQGRYEQAESLFAQALTIWEQTLGPEHPDLAYALEGQAMLFISQGRYQEAELQLKRALILYEQLLGFNEHLPCTSLEERQQKPFSQRALACFGQQPARLHPHIGICLKSLGILYREQGKNEEAEQFLQQALVILEQSLGSGHPDTADATRHLGLLFRVQGRHEEAEALLQRALAVFEQRLGVHHPTTLDVKRAV